MTHLRSITKTVEDEENEPMRKEKCTPIIPSPTMFKNLKTAMYYDDELQFSSCFPPKTGSTNWLKVR